MKPKIQEKKETNYLSSLLQTHPPHLFSPLPSPRKNLNNPIPTGADDQSAVLAPRNVADAFAAHGPVADEVLRADALLERPDADAGVVAGGHGLAAVLGEGEGGDGGGVGEHGVRALTCYTRE